MTAVLAPPSPRQPLPVGRMLSLLLSLLLLLLLLPRAVLGDIRVVVKGSPMLEGIDKPAGFGGVIPDGGVRGLLVAASPEDACSPLVLDAMLPRVAAAGGGEAGEAGAGAPGVNKAADRPPPFIVLIRRSPVLAMATTKDGEGGKNQTTDPAPLPLSPAQIQYNEGRVAQPNHLAWKQALRISDGHRNREMLGLGPSVPPVSVEQPAADGKECSFDQKVRNAQAAGAAAVVVYDSVEEPLIRMMSEAGGEGITIPAVFVTHRTGVALLNLAASATPDAPVEIVVDKREPFPVLYSKLNFTLLAIIIALIVVIVVLGAMFLCSNNRVQAAAAAAAVAVLPLPLVPLVRRRKEVLPLEDVLALPTVRVGGEGLAKGSSVGSKTQLDDALAFFPPTPPASPSRKARRLENDCCAICLSEFLVGDVLTLLPCGGGRHAFHPGCITPWLTKNSSRCPLCNVRIHPSSKMIPSSAEASLAGADDVVDEAAAVAGGAGAEEGASGRAVAGER